jgi:predicted permease
MRILRLSLSGSDFGAKIAIVLLLSFGLGAATLLYTALDRLLRNPLGVTNPDTLVRAVERHPPLMAWEWLPFTTYEAMRPMHSFEGIAVEGEVDTIATTNGLTQPVVAEIVSGGYFSVLGGRAELGRALNRADEVGGAGGVPVVLSHRFWMSEFAGSSSIIGSRLSLQGRSFTVVGVMTKRFVGTQLDSLPDMWLPLAAQPLLSGPSFSIIGRLHSGITIAQAQSEFSGVYRAIKAAEGDTDPRIEGLIQPIAQSAFALHDQFGNAITLLLWGLAMLLLMMCANVSGLMLVKAIKGQRETAIRLALGASRTRLVLVALIESVSLGLSGAGGGLLVAWICAPVLKSLLPPELTQLPVSLIPDLNIDGQAVSLALGVSLIFGVFPAWAASRIEPQRALRSGTATRRPGLLGRWMLILQTGASLILLVGTGLLIHTFYVLAHTNPGFDVEHLIAFTVDSRMEGGSKQLGSVLPGELQRRIGALPGVRSASLAITALMQRVGLKISVALPGQKIPSTAFLNTSTNAVSSTFFDTLGIPIISGHNFSDVDVTRTRPVPIVINEAFAHLIFPNENPLGRIFGMGAPGEVAKATCLVVGVAGDSKYRSLREAMLPIFYGPYSPQTGQVGQFYLYVRTQGPPAAIINSARKVLFSLDPQVTFSKVYTMKEQLSESLWQERLLAVLAGVFSVISALMAGMGLYALLAYDASQRTREFGIRSAVGAQKRDLVVLLLKELARIVVPGVVIGMGACLFLTRIIASALYGIKLLDPVSITAASVIVTAIGLISAWQPIHHAMNVDPAIVLREE